jgi:hypothetical protein
MQDEVIGVVTYVGIIILLQTMGCKSLDADGCYMKLLCLLIKEQKGKATKKPLASCLGEGRKHADNTVKK